MNMDSNPFKAPDARVADAGVANGTFLPDGQVVPAGSGVAWIAKGWEMFKQAPGPWIGIGVVFMVMIIVLSLIPLVNFFVNLLIPVFIGGIMLACKSQEDGNDVRVGDLFAGFSGHFGSLLLVGLIYLAGMIAVIAVAALLGGGIGFGTAMMGGGTPSVAAFLLPMLVVMLLMVPLAMAVWYAPALVVFNEVSPFEAMKASFFVCLKNFVPFLVYGLVMLVLGILACIPLFLGWLVLAPVMYASVYTSYKDMFFRQ
jgi:uncharacterized membrane protein